MRTTTCLVAALLLLSGGGRARAHCDTIDGPVVQAGKMALETGQVERALVWVQPRDEPEVRAAFKRTKEVRALGPAARELADLYFFETLVRLHRAGEGEPYTGLKPSGLPLAPAIAAADAAVERGNAAALTSLLVQATRNGLRQRFDALMSARKHERPGDLAAGRAAVAAYVELVHYVERLHEAALGAEAGEAGHHP